MLGIDSLRGADGNWRVKQFTGRPDATRDAGRETIAWAREAVALGAGEIVLNCMNQDGARKGYDLEQLKKMRSFLHIPLVASGGAGAEPNGRSRASARRTSGRRWWGR